MHKLSQPSADPSFLFRHGDVTARGLGPVLDFSVSVNPLGPPASVLRAIRRELPSLARYPDPDCRPLAERLAAQHGVAPAQVVVGNGANDLIHAIPRAFRPRRVAIAEPTYTEYLRASLLAGAATEHWLPENTDFQPQPFDPEGADLVWLGNPNNPTGKLWPRDWLLAQWVAEHPRSLFVVDEAFLPLCGGEDGRGMIPQVGKLDNLVVIRSLTKLYALPGLRLGYAVTSPERADRLRAHLVPWAVNTLAQAAGLAALDDTAYQERTGRWINQEAIFLGGLLTSFPGHLRVVPSRANFVLARLRYRTASRFNEQLAEHGLVVRDASNFVGLDDHYIRVASRTSRENARLETALASLFPGKGRP